jgi:hypothetical protein
LKYRRDNVTGNLTYKFDDNEAVGFKFNFGRNNFFSSGQIPLDLKFSPDGSTASVLLTRKTAGAFSSEPSELIFAKNGNRARRSKPTLSSDARCSICSRISRSFLADPIYGDEIQQHDSRLQEGANVQYLQPYKFFGNQSLLPSAEIFISIKSTSGFIRRSRAIRTANFCPENINNPNVLYTATRKSIITPVTRKTDGFFQRSSARRSRFALGLFHVRR